MPPSLVDLEQQRSAIFQQMLRLPDFRSGSITTTRGTCGKTNCRCHQPNQPGHGPNVRLTRKVEGYRPMPILFNEDDHFDFDKPANNFRAAVIEYASWGYFDYRMKGEGFDEGYQSVPVNWKTSSERKRGFFKLLSEMTGERP